MSTYNVPLVAVVTHYVKVEADDWEAAIDAAFDEGTPGLMNLDHTYPDVSDWEVADWYTEERATEESSK